MRPKPAWPDATRLDGKTRPPRTNGTPPIHTLPSLTEDLAALGVSPSMTVAVHTALSTVGHVISGPEALIEALHAAVGPTGTIAMPAHTSDLTDPGGWVNPPIPETTWQEARNQMLPFDLNRTPTRAMGVTAELFRTLPDSLRSSHPHCSWSSRGQHAEAITSGHQLSFAQGEHSPLARMYELDASVLLIGVGHERNTSLHLAEYRCRWAPQKRCRRGYPASREAKTTWSAFDDIYWYDADFPEIGVAFERNTDHVRVGHIGDAPARLMPMRPLVDFATTWMNDHRTLG